MTAAALRRAIVLTALAGAGAAGLLASGCRASAPNVARIERVRDNLYLITGGGGNTAAFVTDAGVVVVDTKLPGWGQAILDQIKTVTDRPVVMIINTHTHGDHVLNNGSFKAATEIVAQARTAAHMRQMQEFQGANARYTPTSTFDEKRSLMSGKDQIDLYYFGRGHTDGDAWVVFPALRVAHAGDLFSGKVLPIVDRVHGGSELAYPDTLSKAFKGISGVDTIITGHSTVVPWNDLEEYADFNRDFVDWTKGQLREGANVQQAANGYTLPSRYRGYRITGDAVRSVVSAIYAELRE